MKKDKVVRTKAHLSDTITELEVKNRKVALKAAREAIVLLENDGVLPLAGKSKIAMFGEGVTNTVKGGGGSGEVNERKSTSVYEGMLEAGFQITSAAIIEDYAKTASEHRKDFFEEQQKKAGLLNFSVTMANMKKPYVSPAFPALKEEQLDTETDTCIYIISRICSESYDRQLEPGDYYLSETELHNIRLCAAHYTKLILVINAGGPIDLCALDDIYISANINMSMLGSAGGTAFADVVSGKVSPSGKLSSTWPVHYEDFPYAKEYSYLNDNTVQEYYKEGIYVGYRYFDTFCVRPRYPFGYGLSYTTFTTRAQAVMEGANIRVTAEVVNTGKQPGAEVVQVYVSCPDGKLQKEYQRFVGFAKTSSLEAGESTSMDIEFPISELASYDSENMEYVIESGEYILRVGNSSKDTKAVARMIAEKCMIVSKHCSICPLTEPLEELHKPESHKKPEKEEWKIAGDIPILTISDYEMITTKFHYGEPEAYHDIKVDDIQSRLSVYDLVDFVVGAGNDMLFPMEHYYTVPGAAGYTTNKHFDKGIHDIVFCDGPAGVRLQQKAVAVQGKNIVKAITASIELLNYLPSLVRRFAFGRPEAGTMLYQYTTAFPVGTALAQTWNQELMEEVGLAVNSELEEYGVDVWLAPGMNIHRNPLCGRNYEYFSEDPVLSGKIAAAITRGVQSAGSHYVTLKHFLCNNQEMNRGKMSSNVSERALREIYLKGFEIAVKEGNAKGIMTSYNRVNGVFSAVNHDAVTKVLRNEWGFDGLVITDWDDWKKDCDADAAMRAGVNLLMAGQGKQRKQIRKAIRKGTLDEKCLRRNASHILRLIIQKENGIEI